jgi:hypothetical protein
MKQLLLCLVLLVPPLSAAPQRLELKPQQQALQFTYRFEFARQAQQLSFSLDNASLNNHFRQFRALTPALLQQYLWRDLRAHVAQYPGARLMRLPGKSSLRYKLHATDSQLLQQLDTELKQLQQERMAHYLQQEYYYQLTLPWGEQVIIPDHARLMQDSLPDLLPVATALHQKLANTASRVSLDYISQWIQQIPYQDLSDRQQSAGASYSPPLKLLQENRGDCDSKTVLLAAMLRMLLPDVKLAIIYLPQHALLAVQLPASADDMTVSIDGKDYLLVDPIGPALLPAGQIAAQFQLYTRNNQFGYRLL